METLSSSSHASNLEDASSYDELSLQHSLLFSDSLKDLKNLREQLYSAAEYFEVSYSNDDQKQRVVNTLKDYAVQAIINTVDHLGSASYKVNDLLDGKADEVKVAELRVSCIEQRLQTCQEYKNSEGLSQQSLFITAPKFHKRYILPEINTEPAHIRPRQRSLTIDMGDSVLHHFRAEIQRTTKDTPSVRKGRSPSPSPRPRAFFSKEKRSISPGPSASHFLRTGSLSCRPTTPKTSTSSRSSTPTSLQGRRSTTPTLNKRPQYPSEPWKSVSMHPRFEKDALQEPEQYPSKSKRLFKALLSRRKSKNDPILYSYLDEY